MNLETLKKVLDLLGISLKDIKCSKCGTSIGNETTPDNPTETKVYTGKVTFDMTSDQGEGAYKGTACVLIDPGMVKVTLNGEVAAKGSPHNGKDVWRFLKTGDKYTNPLKFEFTDASDQVYTFTESISVTTESSGKNTETSKTSAWANGNREHFRLSKIGSYYGNNITLEFSNGLKRTVASGVKRQEWPDGVLWKPVSDSNGKAVVLGPRNVHIASVTVRY